MNFLTQKPIYLILIVVIGFVIWKLPEAMQQSESQQNASSAQELDAYLEDKGRPLTKTDSSEMQSFYDLLSTLRSHLHEAKRGNCDLGVVAEATQVRLIGRTFLDYLNDSDPSKEKGYFDQVSTLNSQNPFSKVNQTCGDGFTADMAYQKWHQGLLGYVRNLKEDRLCFVVEVERVVMPKMIADRDFYGGTVQVGITACDLEVGKVLCKQSIDVKSDDSRGLPKKGSAMNQQLYLELMEKAVRETELWCEKWMAE